MRASFFYENWSKFMDMIPYMRGWVAGNKRLSNSNSFNDDENFFSYQRGYRDGWDHRENKVLPSTPKESPYVTDEEYSNYKRGYKDAG